MRSPGSLGKKGAQWRSFMWNGRKKLAAVAIVTRWRHESFREVLDQIFNARGSIAAENVGIIAPCDAQKALLRKLMPESLAIASVDSFQGQEKELIVLSTVRAGGDGIGFVGDYRRLNVAVTRAKRGLLSLVTISR